MCVFVREAVGICMSRVFFCAFWMKPASWEGSLFFWLFSNPWVVALAAGASLVTCILIFVCSPFLLHTEQVPPQGYLTFNDDGSCEADDIRNRDVTSPINEQDVESSSSRGKSLSWKIVWLAVHTWMWDQTLGLRVPFPVRCWGFEYLLWGKAERAGMV